jgi:hypothetical protein
MAKTYKDYSDERRNRFKVIWNRRAETRVRPGDAYLDEVLVVY